MGLGVAEFGPRQAVSEERPERCDERQTHDEVEDAQAPGIGEEVSKAHAEPRPDHRGRDADEEERATTTSMERTGASALT